ncbi:MAG TPA: zf-HC2 domain-containing protein [Acidimicrobiia bacterium]
MSEACDDAFHDVYSYLDREVSWFRSWRLRRHLRACDGCENAYEFEQRLRIVVRTKLAEDASPEFIARLRQAIEQERGG